MMKRDMAQRVLFAGKYPEAADYIKEHNLELGEYRIVSKYTMVLNLSRVVKYFPILIGTWESNVEVKAAYKAFMERYGDQVAK
jgi:hypothetical protein